MADKVPVKGGYNGGSLTGLAEYATGDTLGVAHGGTGLAAVGTNQLLTGHNSSTTGALTSESNLTFDGSTLTVAGAADVSGDLTAGTVNADGDTSAGDNAAIGYTATEGLILTGQGSTSDVTIKNDADATVLSVPTGTTNVGIGTTAPDKLVHLEASTAAGANLQIESTATDGYPGMTFKNDATTWLIYAPNGGSGSNPDAFQIYNTASPYAQLNIRPNDGLTVLGHGIAFNGDTAAANALDDYEEGTWTPVWKFGGASGTVNTQTENAAWYTKIGNMVTVWYRGALSGNPSGSGSLVITGLPYTVKNTTNQYIGTGAWSNLIAFGDGIAVDANFNGTFVNVEKIFSSKTTNVANVQHSDCTQYTQMRFILQYTV